MFKVPSAPPASSKKRPRESNNDESSSSSSSSSSLNVLKRSKTEFNNNDDNQLEMKMSMKTTIKDLQKYIDVNLERRNKYPDDPQQWMESEIKIDSSLKQLQNLATDSSLNDTFVENEGMSAIAQLLLHENVDVVLDAIDLIIEFTEFEHLDHLEYMEQMLDSIFDNEIVQILVGLLAMDDSSTSATHHLQRPQRAIILQILENLLKWDSNRTCLASILSPKTNFCEWMISEISKTDNMDEFHGYVCEILAIFAATTASSILDSSDTSEAVASSVRLAIGRYCDDFLQKINFFRKNAPKTLDEDEILYNIVDCLCSCLMEQEVQNTLRKLEGLELLVLTAKESPKMRHAAIKALNYALLNNQSNCIQFLDIKGHKTLFAILMKLSSTSDNGKKKKKKKSKKKNNSNDSDEKEEEEKSEEHIISILVSILTQIVSMGGNSSDYLKILNKKFSEKNCEKTARILDLLIKYYTKVYIFDQRVESGNWERTLGLINLDSEQREELIFRERMRVGLFVVQRLCIIIAFLWQNQTIQPTIRSKLEQVQIPLSTIAAVLTDYSENIGIDSEEVMVEDNEQQQQRELTQKQSQNFAEKKFLSSLMANLSEPIGDSTTPKINKSIKGKRQSK